MSVVRGSVRRAYSRLRPLRQTVAALVLLAGPALADAPTVEARPDISYGPLPAEQGDLFVPEGPGGPWPAVLLIHGGGWVEGSRTSTDGVARFIAAQGAVVFNIDYRLAALGRPDTRWPAQLVDAQLAVRFLRANAGLFGIDPKRIGAMGDSAGAQLAVFLGVLPRTIRGDQAALYPGERPDVQAVVDQFGPMDLPGMGSYATPSIRPLFGIPMPTGLVLLTASPLPSVTRHTSPVYILHGQADEVVPFQQSRQLRDTMKANGATVTLVPYAGGHEYHGVAPEVVARLQDTAVTWLLRQLRRGAF